MNQIWHIFRKDVRHRWIEIVVLFALLIAYAWNEMRSWAHPGNRAYGMGSIFGIFSNLPDFLGVLIPFTWLLIVIRFVQDESLVGDRQFWITRPYDWRLLLTEKILFALAFINLPLLVLQVFLLTAAHFPPQQHPAGLFSIQLGILWIVLLPTFSLSSITRTIPQFLFAIVAFVLYGICVSYISSKVPNSSFPGPTGAIQGLLLLSVLLAIVFIQYAGRYTNWSRLLLASLGTLIIVIVVVAPYRSFINREYPPLPATQASPVQFALITPKPPDTDENRQGNPGEESDAVYLSFPLGTSGMTPDSIVQLQGQFITIESSTGAHWESGWTRQGFRIYPEQTQVPITFEIKRRIFEQLKTSPVSLKIAFLYKTYKNEDYRELVLPDGEFKLQEIGRCSHTPYSGNVVCLTALPREINLLVTADMSTSTCPLPEKETRAEPGTFARHWTHQQSDGPEIGISPVQTINIYMASTNWNPSVSRLDTSLCPGTPLVLSHPRFLYQAQQTFTFDSVVLSKYSQGGRRGHLTVRPR